MQINNQPQVLLHDVDFDNAILFQRRISVWQQGKCVEYCGTVEKFTETSVIIRKSIPGKCDAYFLREFSEFRVE
ncbi:hypothetical protein N6H14_23495 [Paenibacillus sp. CC-CFT747]|nr:hypothetical protein N6H14_23495 [Paenibacillus sp. CC-CFT747]